MWSFHSKYFLLFRFVHHKEGNFRLELTLSNFSSVFIKECMSFCPHCLWMCLVVETLMSVFFCLFKVTFVCTLKLQCISQSLPSTCEIYYSKSVSSGKHAHEISSKQRGTGSGGLWEYSVCLKFCWWLGYYFIPFLHRLVPCIYLLIITLYIMYHIQTCVNFMRSSKFLLRHEKLPWLQSASRGE